eukprot:14235439-Ditylum_brightwellii.AAC.1
MPATIIPQNKDGQHDPPRRTGLRPRRRQNLVPSKFREQAHTMFQIGENFPAYIEAKIHLHHNNKTAKHNLENNLINHTIMTQYHVSKGLKVFSKKGTEAVMNELKQLHDRSVLDPKDPSELSDEEKKASLQYLMFKIKKICGRIKGRGCADGRKQRTYTPKDNASAPTVAAEALMLSCIIGAMEERDVTTVDIPGAFMQAEMDNVIHMKIEGTMAKLLTKLDPKMYRQYLRSKKGKPVLYIQLKKALYGTLKAALLFWKNLSSCLQEWGFEISPYNWCVANKTIKGCDRHNRQAKEKYGKEAPLTVKRGK